jgi:hypothetical protein
MSEGQWTLVEPETLLPVEDVWPIQSSAPVAAATRTAPDVEVAAKELPDRAPVASAPAA